MQNKYSLFVKDEHLGDFRNLIDMARFMKQQKLIKKADIYNLTKSTFDESIRIVEHKEKNLDSDDDDGEIRRYENNDKYVLFIKDDEKGWYEHGKYLHLMDILPIINTLYPKVNFPNLKSFLHLGIGQFKYDKMRIGYCHEIDRRKRNKPLLTVEILNNLQRREKYKKSLRYTLYILENGVWVNKGNYSGYSEMLELCSPIIKNVTAQKIGDIYRYKRNKNIKIDKYVEK